MFMTLEEEITITDNRRRELFDRRPRTDEEQLQLERITEFFVSLLTRQAQSLFEELSRAGLRIKSVWDLVNTSASYPEAIPALVKHLSRPYHHRNKEGIVRALAVKEAKGVANKAVMEEYLKLPKESPDEPWIFHYRWAFGNTMRIIVTKEDLDQLIDSVLDESNGESRTGFIDALAKIKSPRVIEVLHKLEKDKNQIVAEWARKMLAKKAKVQERKARKKS